MNYNTYQITLPGPNLTLKFVTVAAISLEAAHADIRAAYGEEVEIIASCNL